MGTCCAACLATKVRENGPNAQNGSVTVRPIENPIIVRIASKAVDVAQDFEAEVEQVTQDLRGAIFVDEGTRTLLTGEGHYFTRHGNDIEITWPKCDCGALAEFVWSFYQA